MTSYLREVYGYKSEYDSLDLFIHFPYADKTASLHIHGRLNYTPHPLDEARSYDLDDVINHLESGEPIGNLILARQQYLGGGLYGIDGGAVSKTINSSGSATVESVENPFFSPRYQQ